MSHGFKTILVHYDSTPRAAKRLTLASRIADDFEAHLLSLIHI